MNCFYSSTARRFSYAAFLIASLMFARDAAAQRAGYSVSGTLRDSENQRGVEQVRIELHATDDSLVSFEITRQNGIFEFDNIRPGNYFLVVQTSGYEPARQPVDVSVGGVAGVLITMKRLPGVAPPDAAGRMDVSARELALPKRARDALDKGFERLYDKNDPKGSIPFFEKVLQISPGFFEAHYYVGMADFLAGSTAEAEKELRRSIAASGERYGDAYVALASVLEMDNRFGEAEQSARRGVELAPNSWQGHLELARALLVENRIVEAEDSAVEARDLKPDYAETYITLANIHIRLADTSSLLADVTTYLKLAPAGPYSAKARDIQQQLSRQNPDREFPN